MNSTRKNVTQKPNKQITKQQQHDVDALYLRAHSCVNAAICADKSKRERKKML